MIKSQIDKSMGKSKDADSDQSPIQQEHNSKLRKNSSIDPSKQAENNDEQDDWIVSKEFLEKQD